MLRRIYGKSLLFQSLSRALLSLFVVLSFVLTPSSSVLAAASSCVLNSAHKNIQHVVQIQFDNTHFTRDNPNVPSDLEQMPHLLNFIKSNGVLLTNYHTPLISHTATDILTTLTGVYGDRHGVPVSNSFRYFLPDGTSNTGVSFAYWTDPLFDPSLPASPTDTAYNMLTADGHNAPAPWVPFTRAGCNFGAVATANTVLENNSFDIPKVFGNPSPEYSEFQSNANLAFTDFVGIAVHCAASDALCATSKNGKSDSASRRAGRLYRLQCPLRCEVRESPVGRHRVRQRDAQRSEWTANYESGFQYCRLPWLRRDVSLRLISLRCVHAGAWRTDHVRLYLRCA